MAKFVRLIDHTYCIYRYDSVCYLWNKAYFIIKIFTFIKLCVNLVVSFRKGCLRFSALVLACNQVMIYLYLVSVKNCAFHFPGPLNAFQLNSGAAAGYGFGNFGMNVASFSSKRIKIQCPYCDGTYSNSSNLRVHIKDAHDPNTSSLPVSCELCFLTFKNQSSLRYHRWKYHGGGRNSQSTASSERLGARGSSMLPSESNVSDSEALQDSNLCVSNGWAPCCHQMASIISSFEQWGHNFCILLWRKFVGMWSKTDLANSIPKSYEDKRQKIVYHIPVFDWN